MLCDIRHVVLVSYLVIILVHFRIVCVSLNSSKILLLRQIKHVYLPFKKKDGVSLLSTENMY